MFEKSSIFYNLFLETLKNRMSSCRVRKCLICDKITTSRCSKCKSAGYCCRECQVADWPTHKFFCASLPFPPKMNGNPRVRTIAGLLLNSGSLTPSIVQLPLNIDFESFKLPNTKSFIGAQESTNYMQSNPFTNENLKDSLVFIFRDNFLNDGSSPNKCVENMMKGRNNYPWKGPVLVIKQKGIFPEDLCRNEFDDINSKDFKDVVDYFCWYGNKSPAMEQIIQSRKDELVKMGFQIFQL